LANLEAAAAGEEVDLHQVEIAQETEELVVEVKELLVQLQLSLEVLKVVDYGVLEEGGLKWWELNLILELPVELEDLEEPVILPDF
jgi:hypothetical protein